MVLTHIPSSQCEGHSGEPPVMLMMVAQQGEFGNCPSLLSGHFLTHAGSKAGSGATGKLGTLPGPQAILGQQRITQA